MSDISFLTELTQYPLVWLSHWAKTIWHEGYENDNNKQWNPLELGLQSQCSIYARKITVFLRVTYKKKNYNDNGHQIDRIFMGISRLPTPVLNFFLTMKIIFKCKLNKDFEESRGFQSQWSISSWHIWHEGYDIQGTLKSDMSNMTMTITSESKLNKEFDESKGFEPLCSISSRQVRLDV